MNYLWVIEMWVFETQQWEPTVGCGINREQARREMRDYWIENNPHDKFRVKKYVRQETK